MGSTQSIFNLQPSTFDNDNHDHNNGTATLRTIDSVQLYFFFFNSDRLATTVHYVFFYYHSDKNWLWGEQQGCYKLQQLQFLLKSQDSSTTTTTICNTYFIYFEI